MALERGNLSDVILSGVGNTQALVTCASNKKVYVKSIILHAPEPAGVSSCSAHIYYVPNNGGSVGTASSINRIATLTVYAEETVMFEPSYPLVLTATNDTIQVGAALTSCNFLASGDKES